MTKIDEMNKSQLKEVQFGYLWKEMETLVGRKFDRKEFLRVTMGWENALNGTPHHRAGWDLYEKTKNINPN